MTREECNWVAVRIERGFPVQAKGFRSESLARAQERRWRKDMNLDYDETGVLPIEFAKWG